MEDIKKQITNLVQRGMYRWQICQVTGLSYEDLNIKLHEYGLYADQIESEQFIKKLKELQDEGCSIETMAMKLGTNVFQLKHKINNMSSNPKETASSDMSSEWNKWTPQDEQKLLDLRNSGLTIKQIAKKMGLRYHQVSRRWSKLKTPAIPSTSRSKPNWSKQDIELLKERLKQGNNIQDIAKELGRTEKAVQVKMSNLKLKVLKAKDMKEQEYTPVTISREETILDDFPKGSYDVFDAYNEYSITDDSTENVKAVESTDDITLEVIKQIIDSKRRAVILL